MTMWFPKGRYSKLGSYILDFVLNEEPESEKFEVELFCIDMFSVAILTNKFYSKDNIFCVG